MTDPTPVIQINSIEAFLGVAVILVGMGVAWGTLKTIVSSIKKTLEEEVKPDLQNIRERFMVVEDRVETLWKDKYAPANSPRQLNEYGKKILNDSGIQEIINEKKELLLNVVKQNNVSNAYDAEQTILAVVAELPKHCPDIVDKLKNGAFKVGTSVDSVLLVGGIYLRNLIFPDLGFSLDDIDASTPQTS